MIKILSSIFLGWALGANDSANIFGTAVTSKMVKFRVAVTLTAIFVILGAITLGGKGLETISSLSSMNINNAIAASIASALTVGILTFLKLPISTSQAVVGSILAIGFMNNNINSHNLEKIIICWIATPIGSLIITFILYFIIKKILYFFNPNIFLLSGLKKWGMIIIGSYGAFALGANNVANVTGFFVGNTLTNMQALIIGSVSIALGSITYSKNIMFTVGKSIVKIDSFSALIVVMGEAITVNIYALIGVPVSTSQAIIGAIFAIGLIKGIHTINFKTLLKVFSGWILTPILAFIISLTIYFIQHLKYVP